MCAGLSSMNILHIIHSLTFHVSLTQDASQQFTCCEILLQCPERVLLPFWIIDVENIDSNVEKY